MDSVGSVSQAPVDCSAVPVSRQETYASVAQQANKVALSQAQSANITIVTKEGDTVTLSANKTAELSFFTYNAQGQIAGNPVSASVMSAEMHQNSSFSVTVDGDLNKEEMKEIRRAMRIIQRSAHDVLSGDPDKAAARAAKLADLDQLDVIDVDFKYKQEVSVTQVSTQSAAPPAQDATGSSVPATDASAPVIAPATPETPADAPSTSAAAPSTTTTDTQAKTHLIVLGPSLAGAPLFNSSSVNTWWIPTNKLWDLLQSINGQKQTSKAQSEPLTVEKA